MVRQSLEELTIGTQHTELQDVQLNFSIENISVLKLENPYKSLSQLS